MSGMCLYCFAPLAPDWHMEIVKRTRAEILASDDLWAPAETLPVIEAEVARLKEAAVSGLTRDADYACLELQQPRRVRVRVDRAEFCSEVHRDAWGGNRAAIGESLGEFREDDDPPGPVAVHPGQGTLL